MSDATQEKRGRNVWGLSSSDTESSWGWSWLTSCTLGAHAWPRVLHPSGSAELISCSSINGARASEPLSRVNDTRGWTQGVTLVILRKWVTFFKCSVLVIQSVTLWWIVYFPKRLPDLRGAIFCSRHDFGCIWAGRFNMLTWCSCLMQISPLWHDGSDKSFQSNWSNRLDWDGLYFTATVQSMQQQDYISQLDPTRKLLHVVLPFYATMFLLSSISSRVPASQLCLMASVSERSSRVAFWRWHRYTSYKLWNI